MAPEVITCNGKYDAKASQCHDVWAQARLPWLRGTAAVRGMPRLWLCWWHPAADTIPCMP